MKPMRSLLILLPMQAFAQNQVKSPNGAIELSFSGQRAVSYTVNYRGRPATALQMKLANGGGQAIRNRRVQ